MNIIETKISQLKTNPFRPKKWRVIVLARLKEKNIKGTNSAIEKVFAGEFFNEEIALVIIEVFEEEKKRMEDRLKKITE